MYSATQRMTSSTRGHGRTRSRLRSLALFALAVGVGIQPAAGQSTGRLIGVFGGPADSEQVWNPMVETAERSGFLFGAFVDVPTPLTALRVRADGGFARRGALVLSDTRSNPLDGEVQSEYLTFQLQAKLAASVGPVHVFAVGGPGFDYLVRSREDPLLTQVLVDKHATVFNVVGAAGAGVRLGAALVVEVEGRWVQGLSNAYSGPSAKVRNRSLEWAVRVSRVDPANP